MTKQQAIEETARRIRAARQKRQQAQGQVADAIGMSRTAYCQIENGKRGVRALELARLCEYWQVPYADLFVGYSIQSGKTTERLFWLVELVTSPPCQYLGVIRRGDGMAAFGWTGWDKALRLSRQEDAEAILNQLRQWDWFGLTEETRVTEHIEEATK